jgi:hypothetical protein
LTEITRLFALVKESFTTAQTFDKLQRMLGSHNLAKHSYFT